MFTHLALLSLLTFTATSDNQLSGDWTASEPFAEQVSWRRDATGVRVYLNAARSLSPRPRKLIVFATPNGNTIEQSLGCSAGDGVDWKSQIQHIAAQVRRLREIDRDHEWLLAVVQAPELSWPAYRRDVAGARQVISVLPFSLADELHCQDIVLSCHSGGGAFLWELFDSAEQISDRVCRIVFLDANYSYSDEAQHGDKLLAWLKKGESRQLIVVAYDDREVLLNGRKVVGDGGGTWCASERMLARFRNELELFESDRGPFRIASGLNNRVMFLLHRNPNNQILHTAIVGEMNGLLHSITLGTSLEETWGQFGGPVACANWIQPTPAVEPPRWQARVVDDDSRNMLAIPLRAADAVSGKQLLFDVAALPVVEREPRIVEEILAGNVPDRLRPFVTVSCKRRDAEGTERGVLLRVLPDYLGIGSNTDWMRWPMSPKSAMTITDATNTTLLTSDLSDIVHSAATARLEPQPLTELRESPNTFAEHHSMIESQLINFPDQRLIAGIKKDVIFDVELLSKPHRVAIYGWHRSHGQPIQPAYCGHVDWYMDYSHGVRLVSREVLIDGQPYDLIDLAADPSLHPLVSSSGPLKFTQLRQSSQW